MSTGYRGDLNINPLALMKARLSFNALTYFSYSSLQFTTKIGRLFEASQTDFCRNYVLLIIS